MADEHEKTLKAIQIAIQMEIDGKEYYLKSSQTSSNELGKKLLQSLAQAEDKHRQKFIEIYDAIREKNAWPKVELQPDAGKTLKTIFALATREPASKTGASATELDAVQTAIGMEKKTLDFYTAQRAEVRSDAAQDFYDALTAEEREHSLVLQDYYEYLKDPAGWFTKSEHHSLDGG